MAGDSRDIGEIMSRTGVKDAAVTVQFPLRQRNDPATKLSGRAAGFAGVVWLTGILDDISVTVSEIGATGEYKAVFTPDAVGLWELEVANAAVGFYLRVSIEVQRGSLELLYKVFWNKMKLTKTDSTHYTQYLYDDDESTVLCQQEIVKSSDVDEVRGKSSV